MLRTYKNFEHQHISQIIMKNRTAGDFLKPIFLNFCDNFQRKSLLDIEIEHTQQKYHFLCGVIKLFLAHIRTKSLRVLLKVHVIELKISGNLFVRVNELNIFSRTILLLTASTLTLILMSLLAPSALQKLVRNLLLVRALMYLLITI